MLTHLGIFVASFDVVGLLYEFPDSAGQKFPPCCPETGVSAHPNGEHQMSQTGRIVERFLSGVASLARNIVGGAGIMCSPLLYFLQSRWPQCRLNLICMQIEGSQVKFVAKVAKTEQLKRSEHLTLQTTRCPQLLITCAFKLVFS